MMNPESLSLRDSLRLWYEFAKKSPRNAATLVSLGVVYSTVSAVALPVYLLHLPFYMYKLSRTRDAYVIMVRVGGFDSYLLWFARYTLWAEPSLRAFDAARALRAVSRKAQVGSLTRLAWLRLQSFAFTRFTSVPYVYVKHINFWVIALDVVTSPNREDMGELLKIYTSYGF